ncbi:ras-related small GTP-binding family protein [Actinidia rufa]|uniref:Ras-related small GTP-binding family protein n=1 Tax=Actinidia rufa TaxID=165716 RepID=A0A7J0DR00_9ERIC|nr:ras-related small GTP-binding family protein [Actinidia rufa]
MFSRECEKEKKELNSGPPCGQALLLIVGDSGVIFVHDLSQRRTKTSLHKWAADIAATGTFSAPLGSGGPVASPSLTLWLGAKKARYDKEAVMKFFRMLIRWRYFSDDLPAPNPWSTPVQRPLQRSSKSLSDEDQLYKSTSLIGDPYKYNVLPPLPAQLNLTPTPTLQQPMSNPDNNCSIPRYAVSSSQEISSARLKHSDINV